MNTNVSTERVASHPAAAVLLHADGPFATAYLPAPSAVEDSARRLAGAAKSAIGQLTDADADPDLVAEIAAAAESLDHAAGEQFAIVAAPGTSWAWPMRTGLGRVHARVGSLPQVAPLLAAESMLVPHIRVIADRVGADIAFVDDAARSVDVTTTVTGTELHIHRGQPGGWSQRRFQQRAENTWERNAGLVADAVADLDERTDADAVLVAGDERAVGFLVEALPVAVAEKVIELEHGGRAAGVDVDQMDDEIDDRLIDLRQEQDAAELNAFRSQLSADSATEGLAPTLEALFEGLADSLLIDARIDDDTVAFHGPEPHQVADTAERLHDLGIRPTSGPATETAVRAAMATGCDVHFLAPSGRGPVGFVGATLRTEREPQRNRGR